MEDKKILTDLHGAVASYQMPNHAKELIASGKLLILCGVTASGKNTISNYLVKHGKYEHVVSHTTRHPRENHGILEQSGKEYWFVSPEEMLDMVLQKKFIEVKAIHGDTCYGTSIESVESVIRAGYHPVMEIDVQGVIELVDIVPSLQPIFVLPPSYEVWMERLGTRGEMSDGEKSRRLRSASMEIQTALDHRSFVLVVNHEVEITAAELMRGLDTSVSAQEDNRKLAMELLDVTRNL
jgi:guanylate kinase